jgi:hypothetical protein
MKMNNRITIDVDEAPVESGKFPWTLLIDDYVLATNLDDAAKVADLAAEEVRHYVKVHLDSIAEMDAAEGYQWAIDYLAARDKEDIGTDIALAARDKEDIAGGRPIGTAKSRTKTGKDLGFEKDNPFYDAPVVSEYSDDQAVEDGDLVEASSFTIGPNARANRVTRPVFEKFTRTLGGVLTDITKIKEVWNAALDFPEDDGWRVGEFDGEKLWLIPNANGGLTLLFPSDY